MTPPAATDAELVRRSLAGDQHAFAQLARRHGGAMAKTVRAMGVIPGDVEDVVQAALVACWRALADYDPSRPFPSWAAVIAANKARDWSRRRRVRDFWFRAASLDRPEALDAPDPRAGSENLEHRDRLRRISAAMDTLSGDQRTALVLVTVAGLTQAEAAKALGVSLRAVESRVARGRAALARHLAPSGEEAD